MKPYFEKEEDRTDIFYWDENDNIHNLEGPAVFSKMLKNCEIYFIHGVELSFIEWDHHPEVIAYRNYLKAKGALGI